MKVNLLDHFTAFIVMRSTSNPRITQRRMMIRRYLIVGIIISYSCSSGSQMHLYFFFREMHFYYTFCFCENTNQFIVWLFIHVFRCGVSSNVVAFSDVLFFEFRFVVILRPSKGCSPRFCSFIWYDLSLFGSHFGLFYGTRFWSVRNMS